MAGSGLVLVPRTVGVGVGVYVGTGVGVGVGIGVGVGVGTGVGVGVGIGVGVGVAAATTQERVPPIAPAISRFSSYIAVPLRLVGYIPRTRSTW